MTRVSVLRAGLLTTVQDAGRWGFQHYGVPVSGPMDPWSHRLANVLVGNAATAATLEVTGTGPDLTFEAPASAAITGARFRGELDGARWMSPVVLRVRAGSRLTFGERIAGFRGYLAVSGGFDVPAVLGSRATDLRSRLGGFRGRSLRDGDELPLGRGSANVVGTVPADADWMFSARPCRLRVLPAPETGSRADMAFEALTHGSFTVSPRSDRMGYHLTGSNVRLDSGRRVSGPVATGVIQLPPSGEPVLLMADRQTTGGYALVAVVIAADIPRAGQLGPGDRVEFEPCGPESALRAMIAREQALLAMSL
jgi:antagonist of KipI